MKKPAAKPKADPAVVSAVRAFFAASERNAFTAAQAAMMCQRSRRLPVGTETAAILTAVTKLTDDGHLSKRNDPNGGDPVFQITPVGFSVYEAGA